MNAVVSSTTSCWSCLQVKLGLMDCTVKSVNQNTLTFVAPQAWGTVLAEYWSTPTVYDTDLNALAETTPALVARIETGMLVRSWNYASPDPLVPNDWFGGMITRPSAQVPHVTTTSSTPLYMHKYCTQALHSSTTLKHCTQILHSSTA
jgi:hypothetical protein